MEYKAIEFKATDLQEDGTFSGYASVFGNKDQGGDIVVPGAFDAWLSTWNKAEEPIHMLFNHFPNIVLGVFPDAQPDNIGLKVWGKLDLGTQDGREKYSNLKSKALRGMSIGYEILPGGYYWDKAKEAWMLTSLKIWEISLVTFPMNTLARVGDVKSSIERGGDVTIRKIERALREQGFSQKQAKVIAKHASATLSGSGGDTPGDSEDEEEAGTLRRDGEMDPKELKAIASAVDRLAQRKKGL